MTTSAEDRERWRQIDANAANANHLARMLMQGRVPDAQRQEATNAVNEAIAAKLRADNERARIKADDRARRMRAREIGGRTIAPRELGRSPKGPR